MKTYTYNFNGYYPVGAVATVNAVSRPRAKVLLEEQFKRMNLEQEINIKNINPLDTTGEGVTILLDGNY